MIFRAGDLLLRSFVMFLDDFIRMCFDGFEQGWHERNGGNLSYRMKDEDVEAVKDKLHDTGRHYDMNFSAPELKGAYFTITGSGKYMRNVPLAPEKNIGIIRIDDAGTGYDILWGLEDGAKPTSEIPTHLMNHIARMKATDGACRVIYHAHPANITALTYTLPPEAKAYTRVLWQSETECAVVFPEGVGVVDWMVPGSIDIGIETAKLITKYRAVVWTFHGIFGSGVDFDETFGLVHTIEKAAEIYLKAKSAGIVRTITDDEFKALADAFGVTLNPEFLD